MVAAGVLAPPVGVRMHWTFELEDGLIRLIKLRDEVWWAGIGGPEHTLGRVADGRSVEVPIDPQLEDKATPQAPVLLYFDAESVAGWCLPDHQEGMVLR